MSKKKGLTLIIKEKRNPHESLTLLLQEALEKEIIFKNRKMRITLDFPASFELENGIPQLHISWKSDQYEREEMYTISLQGQASLHLKSQSEDWSTPLFTIDLVRPLPHICLIENEFNDTLFFAFDPHGRLHMENYPSTHVEKLMAFDNGFQGYGVQAALPIPTFPSGREDKEMAEAFELTKQLKQTLSQHPPLSPPLKLFEQACQKAEVDFPQTFVQFLVEWKHHPEFIFSSAATFSEQLKSVLSQLQWDSVPQQEKQAIQWTMHLLRQLHDSWKAGQDPLSVLEQHHWPLMEPLRTKTLSEKNISFPSLIAQQIASLIHYFPPIDFLSKPFISDNANLLCAYFRIYGIDAHTIFPLLDNSKESFDALENYWKEKNHQNLKKEIVFETLLSQRVTPLPIPLKLEEQRPGLVLELQEGQNQQTLALAYDPSGTELKWPILNGKYRIRFQPQLKELPYRVRLRQARQISYPQSQQIYSYESDVLISDNAGGLPVEKTLSMNKVHETWEGYRFYLAGIGQAFDANLNRIQLAVNYDPAKYYLTYPGALLVFIGIILLFWGRKTSR